MSVTVEFLYFLFVAAPATACGPRSGFTIKNMLPPLPNYLLPANIKGMTATVQWYSDEVSILYSFFVVV